MVARCLRLIGGRSGGGPSSAGQQKQHHPDAQRRETAWRHRPGHAIFSLPKAHPPARSASAAFQMSFLIDTDLLSMLERRRVPPKLAAWVQQNEAEIFLS